MEPRRHIGVLSVLCACCARAAPEQVMDALLARNPLRRTQLATAALLTCKQRRPGHVVHGCLCHLVPRTTLLARCTFHRLPGPGCPATAALSLPPSPPHQLHRTLSALCSVRPSHAPSTTPRLRHDASRGTTDQTGGSACSTAARAPRTPRPCDARVRAPAADDSDDNDDEEDDDATPLPPPHDSLRRLSAAFPLHRPPARRPPSARPSDSSLPATSSQSLPHYPAASAAGGGGGGGGPQGGSQRSSAAGGSPHPSSPLPPPMALGAAARHPSWEPQALGGGPRLGQSSYDGGGGGRGWPTAANVPVSMARAGSDPERRQLPGSSSSPQQGVLLAADTPQGPGASPSFAPTTPTAADQPSPASQEQPPPPQDPQQPAAAAQQAQPALPSTASEPAQHASSFPWHRARAGCASLPHFASSRSHHHQQPDGTSPPLADPSTLQRSFTATQQPRLRPPNGAAAWSPMLLPLHPPPLLAEAAGEAEAHAAAPPPLLPPARSGPRVSHYMDLMTSEQQQQQQGGPRRPAPLRVASRMRRRSVGASAAAFSCAFSVWRARRGPGGVCTPPVISPPRAPGVEMWLGCHPPAWLRRRLRAGPCGRGRRGRPNRRPN